MPHGVDVGVGDFDLNFQGNSHIPHWTLLWAASAARVFRAHRPLFIEDAIFSST